MLFLPEKNDACRKVTGDGVVKKTDSSDKVCDGTLQGRPRLASSVDFSRLICFLDRALRGSVPVWS